MARLIIHIGPGKCGSSSIQDFFSSRPQPCNETTSYSLLSAVKIDKLEKDPDDKNAINYFKNILSDKLVGNNTVILSQEYLFETPSVVNQICQLAQKLSNDISIIGYCRQQSNFLISQYSQWLFRSPARTKEVIKYVEHLGIDWKLFTGLERQLIASIYNDFKSARMLGGYQVLNWNDSYQKLASHVAKNNAVIHCGLLPSRGSDKTLIDDFCEKAKLTPLAHVKEQATKISNPSFSHDIVEAINNAITHDYTMPGPHANNSLIQQLSSELVPASDIKVKNNFLEKLKIYIDNYYWQSNKTHCERYQLDINYFNKPEADDKKTIIDTIKNENQYRQQNQANAIYDYRALSTKLMQLCLKQHKL